MGYRRYIKPGYFDFNLHKLRISIKSILNSGTDEKEFRILKISL